MGGRTGERMDRMEEGHEGVKDGREGGWYDMREDWKGGKHNEREA
jgi:hypothetical protein